MLQIKLARRNGLRKTFAIPENVLNRTVLSLEKHPVILVLNLLRNRQMNLTPIKVSISLRADDN